jgi:hypothetical protein
VPRKSQKRVVGISTPCPLESDKLTLIGVAVMSAWCRAQADIIGPERGVEANGASDSTTAAFLRVW